MASAKAPLRRKVQPAEVRCAQCPLRQLPVFRAFEQEELKFVEWFKTAERSVKAGETILIEGESSPHLYTILEGWAFRFKALPDDRRQILSFALPGDFLGLQGPVLKEMKHSVEALTDVKLCVFPRERLWKLYSTHPELAHDLVWLAMRGERLGDENLLSLGRRSATERAAHLILELHQRCSALSLAKGNQFELPLTQRHFADAIGLSLVHTNRSLRWLQKTGLLTISGRDVTLKEPERLMAIAKFEHEARTRQPII